MRYAEHALGLETRDDFVNPLTTPEKEVLQLYSRLLRDFNNTPNSLSSRWFEFGFCFCRNRDERLRLRALYLDLLNSGARLRDITQAYESKSLSILMKSKGLNISFFEKKRQFLP